MHRNWSMQPVGKGNRDSRGRVERLFVLCLSRLHDKAGQLYASGLAQGIIRPEEMEDEILRYFTKKKSGLQDFYSYYGEQWDYYYQVSEASDEDFLFLLQRARSEFERLYAPTVLDVAYYIKQLVQFPRFDEHWQTLRIHFMQKWKSLLEQRKWNFQEKHIERLCEDYYRMASSHANMLQNVGGKGDGLSPRLAWLQLTQSPEMRTKIKKLAPVIRNSTLIQELNRVLGRKKADEERLYRAMCGRTPVALWRSATHSDIVGITEGDNLNALLPTEYCYLFDQDLENIFYRRYTEKKLSVFDSVSRQTERAEASSHFGHDLQKHVRYGPFVVCVDTSGSMEGVRETLAKAIVLSLALISDRLRRPCKVILFSDQTEIIELQNLYTDLPLLENFLCNAFHGGSDMSCAIQESVRVLMGEDFRYADLLWISDFDMSPIALVWNQYVCELKQRGMNLYAVAFGRRMEKSYMDLADRIWKVGDK
ncbi:MAG: hypothetical protein LUC45_07300 [Paraprevotella sp.]|nr:hypothetical protein [Paraprevotella sp.]